MRVRIDQFYVQVFRVLFVSVFLTLSLASCSSGISTSQISPQEEVLAEVTDIASSQPEATDLSPTERTSTPEISIEEHTPQAVEPTQVDAISTDLPAPKPLGEGEWMELPVIPSLSERAMQIFAEGIASGNDPHAFSKVGDCQNVPSMFVSIFDYPGFFTLGDEYEYLQGTIDWYVGSFKRESQAVRRGFNAASVVSPVWADPESCEIGEDPLTCEIRIHNPSVAIVSLETWWAGNPENYEKYVRQILETLIEENVLPILATKADNLEGDHHINSILARLANEYQIPLWNFWLAVQPLPNHGLMEDGFHLTFDSNEFDDPQVMKAAWPWRNLTALQVLDTVRKAVQQ